MNWNKKKIVIYSVFIIVMAFLVAYRLPYYIYKPGGADALSPVVEVADGYESEGDMHLVTVRGGQATPLQYLWALTQPHQEIERLEDVFPEGISQEEYFQAQLQMMESSQEASTVVAYQAANQEIDISYEGVYVVTVLEGMPAYDKLETGDKITAINDQVIKDAEELIEMVSGMEAGEEISLTIDREETQINEVVTLAAFPDNPDQVGIGIQLVTNREVTVDPEITFTSGEIGGPSAGLMFSLEIYDQLTEEDFTKGYEIAGTGEISYEGEVGRIGGIDKKVIAADNEGCTIFFAPNEGGAEGSNYQVAVETANEIDTSMEIVPVDTFEDAITYLENLE
ncbi:SepM family pheromone-processing serine protease [Paraliobacillus sediminis]|uniref:SepM family pheromone-processing serine protease n=1 Tax=Paraliobacillus sediminis TaxID=1885916 RepID=UPI000E3B7832|nr:SepM family pheromone-processing serine protease [Paraliobacillus sediminis]